MAEAKKNNYANIETIANLLKADGVESLLKNVQNTEKKVSEITRQERRRLLEAMKDMRFTLTKLRGYSEAIITQGGVSVKDVDPSTMESKLVKGLYLAGEVLDLDAVTGGYNLQIAWSTGMVAGRSVE